MPTIPKNSITIFRTLRAFIQAGGSKDAPIVDKLCSKYGIDVKIFRPEDGRPAEILKESAEEQLKRLGLVP